MRKKGTASLIGVTVFALGSFVATLVLGYRPNLGLDLQGGVSLVLQPVKEGKKLTKVSADALEQSQSIIENRVNALGVGEPEITVQGSTIVVEVPGDSDQKSLLERVGKTAELRFRPVLEPPTSGAPKNAKKTIAQLRKELSIPEGVTAKQIYADEQAKQPQPQTPLDANGQPIINSEIPAPTDTAAPSTTVSGPTTAASGAGTGGKNSAKALNARRQSAAPAAEAESASGAQSSATTTTPAAAPTTTAYVPLNQWGVNVSDKKYAELLQLEQLVAAEAEAVTAPADDKAELPVTLLGRPINGSTSKYKLGPTMLTGKAVSTATAGLDQTGQWTVNPEFKAGKDGIDLFNAAAAKCNAGAPECPGTAPGEGGAANVGALAMVLDGTVLSAPAINAAEFKKDQIVISGNFTETEAKDLALALRYGSLPLELEPQTVKTVSATLGSGALHAGLVAGAVGLLLVFVYIMLYYRLLGAVTVASLILTSMILWSIICFMGEKVGLSLTLAGIVGIIVSIGVSLDSSVVYFENLREDVRGGRTLRSVVDRSFTNAYGTIVKADSSSLIGALVLYFLSVGPVKGFALFLAITTVLDMAMTYLFIRPATSLLTQSKLGDRLALFGISIPKQPAATPADAPAKPEESEATVSDARANELGDVR